MVRTCILCKKDSTPTNPLSFHLFPKDVLLREKWLTATNISKITNFSALCSEHFTQDSFQINCGFELKKRLKKNAIPQLELGQEESVSDNNDYDDSQIKTLAADNCITERKSVTVTYIEPNVTTFGASAKSNDLNVLNNSQPLNSIQEGDISEQEFKEDFTIDSDNKSYQEIFILDKHSSSKSLKRKKKIVDVRPKKKFRYTKDFETKYILREDFTSNRGWENFLEFVASKDAQNKRARAKNHRQTKVIRNLKKMITLLKER